MPGLMPSDRLGKPGRKGLKPSRGCGPLTCDYDLVAYAIANGFFVTLPSSSGNPDIEHDCECVCPLLPSGTFELTHVSGDLFQYPASPATISIDECAEGCGRDVWIFGRLFCNFFGNPAVCFGILNIANSLSATPHSLQWGKVFTDGILPLSGTVPAYYGCATGTTVGQNPCVSGGDASYSLG